MCMHVCLFTEASRGYQVFWSWSYIDGYYPPSVIAKNQGWVFCKSRYRELNLRLLQEQPVLISTGPPLSYPFFSSSSRSVSPGKCHGCFGCLSISLWNSSDPNWWVHRRLPFYLSVLRFFIFLFFMQPYFLCRLSHCHQHNLCWIPLSLLSALLHTRLLWTSIAHLNIYSFQTALSFLWHFHMWYGIFTFLITLLRGG